MSTLLQPVIALEGPDEEPAGIGALPGGGAGFALLLRAWAAVQLVSLLLVARAARRRVAIALLAPLPLMQAATRSPQGSSSA